MSTRYADQAAHLNQRMVIIRRLRTNHLNEARAQLIALIDKAVILATKQPEVSVRYFQRSLIVWYASTELICQSCFKSSRLASSVAVAPVRWLTGDKLAPRIAPRLRSCSSPARSPSPGKDFSAAIMSQRRHQQTGRPIQVEAVTASQPSMKFSAPGNMRRSQ